MNIRGSHLLVAIILFASQPIYAFAADTCEVTIETIVPAPSAEVGPAEREGLSPLVRMDLAKRGGPSASEDGWHLASRETLEFPEPGNVRFIPINERGVSAIELRHLAGKAPDWVVLGNDGVPVGSPSSPCPTSYYNGIVFRFKDRLVGITVHPLGPIREPNDQSAESAKAERLPKD